MEPAELEASDIETVDIMYRGETFTFPADQNDFDYDSAVAMRDQDLDGVIRAILSDADYEKFRALKPLRLRDAANLFEAYNEAVGITPGN